MKKVYKVLLISILSVAVSLMVVLPQFTSDFVLAKDDEKKSEDKKDDKKDDDKPYNPSTDDIAEHKEAVIDSEALTGNKEVDENESDKNVEKEDDTIWTIYAQFIMQTKIDDKEEKKQKEQKKGWLEKKVHQAYKGSMGGIIGNGGTYLDISYNKMYRMGNTVRKDKEEKDSVGTQMASFLSTYSHYGYIKTMSGQKAIASSTDSTAGLGRGLFGGFISIALVIYNLINQLLDWFISALIASNPIALLGIGDSSIVKDNPISAALHHFFHNIGLNSKFWDRLASAGLTIITLICIVIIMWFVMTGSRQSAMKTFKEWVVRTLGIVVAATLVLYFSSAMAKQVQNLYKNQHVDNNIVSKHIFNARGWAASSNLSPNGLKSNSFPTAKADEGHIDKDFDPVRSRDLISDINETTYSTLYNMSEGEAAFDLLNTWMSNNNFNVNTYIGDINRGNLPNGDGSLPAFDNYKEEFGGKDPKHWENKNIEYSMWSATQHVDDELKKVDSKYFKPDSTVGVRQGDSFSTQSVVLMLQSSFDNKGASFYGYNISPTGIQGKAKNQTTVKTEWKEATLPGDGAIGVAGSYFGLASDAITVIIIGVGVFLALLTLNFFEAFKRIGVNLGSVVTFGSPYALLSLIVLSIMFVLSLLVAGMATGVFIKLADELAKAIDKISLGYIPSGFIDIVISFAKIFLAYIFAIRKPKSGVYPPLKSFVSFPLTSIAFKYDDRVKQMSGNMRNQGKAGFRAMGETIKETGTDAVGVGVQSRRSVSSFGAGVAGGAFGAKYANNKRRSSDRNLRRHGILSSAKETAQNAHTGNRSASANAYDNGSRKAFGDLREQRSQYKDAQDKRNKLRELGYTEDEINQVMNEDQYYNNEQGEENSSAKAQSNISRREQSSDDRPSAKDPIPTSKRVEEQENKSQQSNESNQSSNVSSEQQSNRTDRLSKDMAKEGAKDVAIDSAVQGTGVDKHVPDGVSDAAEGVSSIADGVSGATVAGSVANEERKRLDTNQKPIANQQKNTTSSNNKANSNNSSSNQRNNNASEARSNGANKRTDKQQTRRQTTTKEGTTQTQEQSSTTVNNGSNSQPQNKRNDNRSSNTKQRQRRRPSYKESKQKQQQAQNKNVKQSNSSEPSKPQNKKNSYDSKLDSSQRKRPNSKSSSKKQQTSSKKPEVKHQERKSNQPKRTTQTKQVKQNKSKPTKQVNKKQVKTKTDRVETNDVETNTDTRTYNESLNKNRKR